MRWTGLAGMVGAGAMLTVASTGLAPTSGRADTLVSENPWSTAYVYTKHPTDCMDGTYVVPAGITRVRIDATGSAGQDGTPAYHHNSIFNPNDVTLVPGGKGGPGTHMIADVPVKPGQTLYAGVDKGPYFPGKGIAKQKGGGGGKAAWVATKFSEENGTLDGTPTGPPATFCNVDDPLVVAAGGGGGGAAEDAVSFEVNPGGNGGTEVVGGSFGCVRDCSQDGYTGGGPARHGPGGGGKHGTPTNGGGEGGKGNTPTDVNCTAGQPGQPGRYLMGGPGGNVGLPDTPFYPLDIRNAEWGGISDECSRNSADIFRGGGGGQGGAGYMGGGGGAGGSDYQGAGGGGGAGSSYVKPGGTEVRRELGDSNLLGSVINGAVFAHHIEITPLGAPPAITSASEVNWVEGATDNYFSVTSTGAPAPRMQFSNVPGFLYAYPHQRFNGDYASYGRADEPADCGEPASGGATSYHCTGTLRLDPYTQLVPGRYEITVTVTSPEPSFVDVATQTLVLNVAPNPNTPGTTTTTTTEPGPPPPPPPPPPVPTDWRSVACAGADCTLAGSTSGSAGVIGSVPAGGGHTAREILTDVDALNGVACPATSGCFAVGNAAGGGRVVPTTGTGDALSAADAVAVPSTTSLNGIACPTTTTCIAVGAQGTSTGVAVPIAVSEGTATPGSAFGVSEAATLERVVCPTATTCVAMGTSSDATGGAAGVVAVLTIDSGGSITGSEAVRVPSVPLVDVACPGSTGCLAVGNQQVVPITLGPPVSVGTALTIGEGDHLTAISCYAEANCEAVGRTANPSVDADNGVLTPLTVADSSWSAGASRAMGGDLRPSALACSSERCTLSGTTSQNRPATTVIQPTAITSAGAATFGSRLETGMSIRGGSQGEFIVTTSGSPKPALSASGVPDGLTFHDDGNGTAILSGFPSGFQVGDRSVTITASGSGFPTVTQTLTLTLDRNPTFVRLPDTSATRQTYGQPVSSTPFVKFEGHPTPSLVALGGLPPGVTLVDNGDGTASFSGTPTAAGAYWIDLKASNDRYPDSRGDLGIEVAPASAPFSTTVNGSSDPTTVAYPSGVTLGVTGLPANAAGHVKFEGGAGCEFDYPAATSCSTFPGILAGNYTLTARFTPSDRNYRIADSTNQLSLTVGRGTFAPFALAVNGGTSAALHYTDDTTFTVSGVPDEAEGRILVGTGGSVCTILTPARSCTASTWGSSGSAHQLFTGTYPDTAASFVPSVQSRTYLGASSANTVDVTVDTLALPFTISTNTATVTQAGTFTLGASVPFPAFSPTDHPGISRNTIDAGIVRYYTSGGALLCEGLLNSSHDGSCQTLPSLAAGTYSGVHATFTDYESGRYFTASSANTLDLAVDPRPSPFSVAVSGAGSSGTIAAGQRAGLTLAPGSRLPDDAAGTITFHQADGTVLCTVAAGPYSSCLTPSSLGLGTYAGIYATFTSTNPNVAGSTSTNTLSLVVEEVAYSVDISLIDAGPFTYASTVLYPRFRVDRVNTNGPTSFGTVWFYSEDGRLICSTPYGNNPGVPYCDSLGGTPLDVGTHGVYATFSDGTGHSGPSNSSINVEVTKAATFVHLLSGGGGTYGASPSPLRATVDRNSAASGTGDRPHQGTVTFYTADDVELCHFSLPATSCLRPTDLAAGTYASVYATFTDTSGNFDGSTTNDGGQTVTFTVAPVSVQFDVTASASAVVYGETVTFGSTLPAIPGTVTVKKGGTELCSWASPDAGCSVPTVAGPLDPGNNLAITAQLTSASGNYTNATSQNSTVVYVDKDATTTTLTVTPDSKTWSDGQSSTFAVAVTTAHGEPVPTGAPVSVALGSDHCTINLDAGGAGSCSFDPTSLQAGATNATASFAGDANLVQSSAQAPFRVSALPTTFSINAAGNVINASYGDYSVYTFSGIPAGAPQAVQLFTPDGTQLCSLRPDNPFAGDCGTIPAGDYYGVHAFFPGDGRYGAANSTNFVTLHVSPSHTTMQVVSDHGRYADPSPFPVYIRLVPDHWALPSGIVVSIHVGNKSCLTSIDVNGNGSCSISSSALDVGHYPMSATFFGDDNLEPSSGEGTFDVISALQSITFGSTPPTNATYGDTPYALSVSAPGGPVAVTTSGPCAVSGTGVSRTVSYTGAGRCTLTADQPGNSNYLRADRVQQSFDIGRATLTMTPNDKSKIYGDADPIFDYTLTGLANGDPDPLSQGECRPSSYGQREYTPVGTYEITCLGGDSGPNYTLDQIATGQYRVDQATLTAVAGDQSKVYGTPDPRPAAITGFRNGEPVFVTTWPTCAPPGAHAAVGLYTDVVCTGGSPGSNNYVFGPSTPGTLAVTPATLVMVPDNVTKFYGAADPAFTSRIDHGDHGLANGDTESVVVTPPTCSAADPHTIVGHYAVTCSGGDAGPNYVVDVTATGDLSVRAAPLTIAVDDKTATFGQADPPFTFQVSGFVNGESFSGADPHITCNRTTVGRTPEQGEVGPWQISCVAQTPDAAFSNYAFQPGTGTLTVAPATLTITPDAKTRAYGQADPAFTFAISGYVSGYGPRATDVDPTCGVAGPHANVGAYPISCGGGNAGPDYVFTAAPANLVVTQATLVVTPRVPPLTYGDPFLGGFDIAGLVNGDTAAVVSPPVACGIAGPHANVGDYTVTCSGGDPGPNYVLDTSATATQHILARPLAITPRDLTVAYGQPQTFAYDLVGLANGDTASVLTPDPPCGVTGAHTAVGFYAITCTGASAGPNYVLSFPHAAQLTVTPATLVVTPADQSRSYLEADPAFTFTLGGLVAGDTLAAQPLCGVSGAHDDAGTYDIICTAGDGGDNYVFDTSATAHLTVSPLPTTTSLSLTSPLDYGSEDSSPLSVTVASTRGDPLGTVSFLEGTTELCSDSVRLDGTASCTLGGSQLPAGTHTIRAEFTPGTANFLASASDPLDLTIDATATSTPSIDAPLGVGDTQVTGTSSEPLGTQVDLYATTGGADPVLVGTTTVLYGYWVIDLPAPLTLADVVTAKATDIAGGRAQSAPSPALTVLDRPARPTVDGPMHNGATQVSGTANAPDGADVRVYFGDSWVGTAHVTDGRWLLTEIDYYPYTFTLHTGLLVFARVEPTGPNMAPSLKSVGTLVRTTTHLVTADFDGDRVPDLSVFRGFAGDWFAHPAAGDDLALNWGAAGDVPVSADFDGDGRADAAIYRPSTGLWAIHPSGGFSADDDRFLTFGGVPGDIPVATDFDGDGRAEIAIFRPSQEAWYVHSVTYQYDWDPLRFGIGDDVPVVADWDGDGTADIAVFRPTTGDWFVRQSSDGAVTGFHYGAPGDVPVPGDYDGDYLTDIAIFRPSTGLWAIRNSGDGSDTFVTYGGVGGDIPVAADYDNDGRTDVAIFRPSTSVWYVHRSSDDVDTAMVYGIDGDIPLPIPDAVRRAFGG